MIIGGETRDYARDTSILTIAMTVLAALHRLGEYGRTWRSILMARTTRSRCQSHDVDRVGMRLPKGADSVTRHARGVVWCGGGRACSKVTLVSALFLCAIPPHDRQPPIVRAALWKWARDGRSELYLFCACYTVICIRPLRRAIEGSTPCTMQREKARLTHAGEAGGTRRQREVRRRAILARIARRRRAAALQYYYSKRLSGRWDGRYRCVEGKLHGAAFRRATPSIRGMRSIRLTAAVCCRYEEGAVRGRSLRPGVYKWCPLCCLAAPSSQQQLRSD